MTVAFEPVQLLDAILEANRRATGGDQGARLNPADFPDSLPLVALSCIDARLNHQLPDRLGVPEEKFIWLRNSGNIIFDPMSSMMRTLALACAIKGGKEIAVIGHTDCLVCKTSVLQLTDRFKALGVDRARLPENLNEFFGLFASERQNVIRAVETIRSSPLIGTKVPVHGLLMDIQTGRVEQLINGYAALGSVASEFTAAIKEPVSGMGGFPNLADFKLGEMKFPESKIGETVTESLDLKMSSSEEIGASRAEQVQAAQEPAHEQLQERRPTEPAKQLDKYKRFRIIGTDQKAYGPVTGAKLLEWIADGRIDWKTPAQVEGSSLWKPLSSFVEKAKPPTIPIPPGIRAMLHPKDRRRQ